MNYTRTFQFPDGNPADGGQVRTELDRIGFAVNATISGLGWTDAQETWTYASADGPTGVVTLQSDATLRYSVGMRVRYAQGTVKYGIVTAVTATTLTFYGGTDYALANAAIASPAFSAHKAPFGFPLDPRKWTVEQLDTTSRSQATPTNDTWYNLGTTNSQLSIPIGAWIVQYKVRMYIDNASGGATVSYVFSTLSTGNNTDSDPEFTAGAYLAENSDLNELMPTFFVEKRLTLASKTLYYLNGKTIWTGGTMGTLAFDCTSGDTVTKVIRAICAYL